MLTFLGRDCHVSLHWLYNFTLFLGILGFKGFLFLQVRLIFSLPPVSFLSSGAYISCWGGCGCLILVFFSILISVNLSFRADTSCLKLLFLLLLNFRIWLPHGIRLFRDFILFDRVLYTGGWRNFRDIALARLVGILILLLGRRGRRFLLLFFLGLS